LYFSKLKHILFCIFLNSLTLGNQFNFNFSFQKITREDGLTDNRYNDHIFEDSRGFVWISSIEGLSRYDGIRVKTYRFESGLKTNNIQSKFFEDKGGNIWFTTYEAINCFDTRLDTIYNFSIKDENSDYQAFHLDTIENYLWLRAGKTIYKWNIIKKNDDYEPVIENIHSKKFKVTLKESGVLKNIAVHINKDSLLFINPSKSIKPAFFKVPSFTNFTYLENDKWLLYNKSSIYIFDKLNPQKILTAKNNRQVSIFDAIKYNDDLLFLSTLNNGIYLYNWRKQEFQSQFAHSITNSFSLSSNAPKKLYISPSGYLWTSHKNIGIDYTFINKRNFTNPFSEGLEGNVDVTSIAEDSEGNVYVSSRKQGVFVFSYKGEYVSHLKYPFSNERKLWQIIKHENDRFFGITADNIFNINFKDTSIFNITPKTDSLYFRFATKVFPNRYLVSTNLGIIEIINAGNNQYDFEFCKEFYDYKEFNFAQIYQTKNKQVFIPYNANELWLYTANQNNLTLKKQLQCNLEFYGFCESNNRQGIVWAGTSKGLKKINNQYEVLSEFKNTSELSNGNVYGVVEDSIGYLWLSTNKGLWQYNLNETSNKSIHFNESDGLISSIFSLLHSTLYSKSGFIWMGTNKGLVVFHPDSIKIHKEIPKLHLEELHVNDTQSFKDSIEFNNTLKLKYDQNTLTLDIRAINLYKAKQNKIHYQLTNYDDKDKWQQINNGEKIRYTKIKPGEYTLNAFAEDANGHKSEMKKLLSLEIHPPWYNTTWFYALCALGLSLLAYTMYKLRINYIIEQQAKKANIERLEAEVLLKEQAKKTELEKLKNQVMEVEMIALRAQMNPHFLFNSLNSIKSLILKTKEKEASQYLSKFSTLLRSILNNSEKQKIKLSEEIEALHLYIELESLRFSSNFNYQIQIDKTIDSSFIRIPPLLLQPFVENAIWHGLLPKTSGNSKLNINIIRNSDFLYFEIEDNGVGRKKAATLPKKEKEKSYGIEITKKRIQLLHPENDIEIIDLVDNNQQALGTKVVIKLFAPE